MRIKIIPLELNNIVEITYVTDQTFIALDYYKNIYIINFALQYNRVDVKSIDKIVFNELLNFAELKI